MVLTRIMHNETQKIHLIPLFFCIGTLIVYLLASFSTETGYVFLAYFFWLLLIIELSFYLPYLMLRTHTHKMVEIILLLMIFLMFSWPSFIFSQPSFIQDYITHIRAEPYLLSYETYGKITYLEEHGSFFLHYLILYIIGLVSYGIHINSSFLIYCNFIIVFVLSLSISFIIKTKTRNMLLAILVMAFLANMASPAQIERGIPTVMAIFWIVLLRFFSVGIQKGRIMLIPVTVALTFSNLLTVIFLSAFVVLLLINQTLIAHLYSRRTKFQSISSRIYPFLLLSLVMWIVKIIYDTLSFLYFQGYLRSISKLLEGLSLFFRSQELRPLGSSIQPAMQLPYVLQQVIRNLRLTSLLCFIAISSIIISYCIYVLRREYKLERSYNTSVLTFYLANFGLTALFYIASLSNQDYWDMFGIWLLYTQVLSTPLALSVVMGYLVKNSNNGKASLHKWGRRFALIFITFTSLTALLQTVIYPSGGSLTLMEFNSYGQYYYYKRNLLFIPEHSPIYMNIEVLNDTILAQNIYLLSRAGILQPLNVFTGYLTSGHRPNVIRQFEMISNVIYDCGSYRSILKNGTLYIINVLGAYK